MVLIKCKCGCFYTLNRIVLNRTTNLDRRCPNCGEEHTLSNYTSIRSIDEVLEGDLIEIRCIPDDSVVEVNFRLP